MKKTNTIIRNYLIFGTPFVIITMIWSSLLLSKSPSPDTPYIVKILWELFSWNLILWFITLFLFFILNMISSSAREQTLKKIAFIKDRDEREDAITGIAAKKAYLSTLSALIFMLFLSVFSFQLKNLPAEEQINGKTKAITIGFALDFFEKNTIPSDQAHQNIVSSHDIPLSKTAILLLILIWQIASFSIVAKSEMQRGLE